MLLITAVAKACALLTAADIVAVQGEKPTKAREWRPRHDESRCYFALPTAAKSVSLEVTRGPLATEFADRLRVALKQKKRMPMLG